jgi:hypothetical protein
MNTEHVASLARLRPTLHDTDGDFTARGSLRAVRAEAVRQTRWVQRACSRTLTPHTPDASGPIRSTARACRTDRSDGLRQMGEDIPSWFD